MNFIDKLFAKGREYSAYEVAMYFCRGNSLKDDEKHIRIFSQLIKRSYRDTSLILEKFVENGVLKKVDGEYEAIYEILVRKKQGFNEEFKEYMASFIKITGKKRTKGISAKSKFRQRMRDGYKLYELVSVVQKANDDPFHIENDYKYVTPDYCLQGKTVNNYVSQ